MDTWADVAELIGTKTLQGGLVARCASGLLLSSCQGGEVALVPPVLDVPRRARIEKACPQGKDTYLVFLSDVDNVDTASLLVGCHCLMRQKDIPPEAFSQRTIAHDWRGWEVRDKRFGFLGVVKSVDTLPGQDLLVVARITEQDFSRFSCGGEENILKEDAFGGAPTLLIPFVDEFVLCGDMENLCVWVAVPDGLLELERVL